MLYFRKELGKGRVFRQGGPDRQIGKSPRDSAQVLLVPKKWKWEKVIPSFREREVKKGRNLAREKTSRKRGWLLRVGEKGKHLAREIHKPGDFA